MGQQRGTSTKEEEQHCCAQCCLSRDEARGGCGKQRGTVGWNTGHPQPGWKAKDLQQMNPNQGSLTLNGSAQHLGNPGTTIVADERYLTQAPGTPAAGRMAPDLPITLGPTLGPTLRTTVRAMGTSYRSNTSRRTSSWRTPRGAPASTTWWRRGRPTPAWGSLSTGDSTRPGSSTGPVWRETGWWTADMNRSPP